MTLEPEAVVEAVLGVEDGAAVIGWAGLLALQSGAQVTWIVQLAEMWTALAPWSQATAVGNSPRQRSCRK